MKVSLHWLNQFVKVDDIAPKELADKLTFAGVEVEDVFTMAKATNLVIGEILSCEKHPDSDHLHVLQVDEGAKYGIHQIVCGAPNARKGLKVIVAREGAVLPLVTIAKSEIRGVVSDGMCCALYELGVDKKYLSEKQCAGIEELPLDAPLGEENVLGYLGLDDVVLDLDLLPSRSDLYAVKNVAEEVGALLSRPVKDVKVEALPRQKSDFHVGSLTEKCPLFAFAEAHGVVSKPSPLWLQRILASEGVRSINSVVDIGNYVMLLTGQPLNLYDLDKLPTKELVVKDDYAGDFLAMDDKHYALQKGDLVVTSSSRPMCLAGIMTSKECAVDEKTVNVGIEAALFQGAAIRHTSNRLGLVSESSSRFVKGLNPDQGEEVIALALNLLHDLSEAKSVSEDVVYDTLAHAKRTVATSLSYINSRLGTSFSYAEVKAVLERDHLTYLSEKGDAFTLAIPAYRVDLVGEADISEEVIRLLGFEHIQSKLPSASLSLQGGLNARQKTKLALRNYLRHTGLAECVTYSLVDAKHADSFAYVNAGAGYRLKNPMTDDHEYLRKNILWSLLDVATYNCAHQEKNLALYEISDLDQPGKASTHLAVVLVGEALEQGSLKMRPYDFYSIKGVFEGIVALLGINENRYSYQRLVSQKAEFHPGQSAAIYLGHTLVGVMGALHPSYIEANDLPKNAVALELDLGAFLDLKTSAEKAIVPARYPSISRDLAFVVDEKVSYEEIRREIKHTDKLIVDVSLFDLYEGENIALGKKSIALSLSFQDPEKTLKDEEVNAIVAKVIGALKMRFAAEIRQ
jgi:phenylalanyl-tRNA synthetase beta chain